MKKTKISIVGLGYVGLPLALALGKHFNVIGYDYNKERINQFKDFKKEVDTYIKGIDLENKSIKLEINDFF